MVNPLLAVYNAFLGFLSCLPAPFINFISFTAALFVITAIVMVIIQH